MKNKKKLKHRCMIVMLMMGVLLEGCSLQKESQQKREVAKYATPHTTQDDADNLLSNRKKVVNTKGYMLYDQTVVKVRLNLEGLSKFDKFDDVKCYLDDKMVSDQTKIVQGSDHILIFEITKYVQEFNKIEVFYNGKTEMIEVGDYRMEKYRKDEIPENEKMELLSYEKEDSTNMFDAKFQIDGDREKYELQYYVSKEVLNSENVKINAQDVDGTYKVHCECTKEMLKEQNRYSIEFDMYILQVNKENGNSSVVCKCFVPLTI